MNCKLPDRDQRMDDFLMGQLSRKESEEYEIHLFGCRDCLNEIRIREQAIKLIKRERKSLLLDYTRQSAPKQRGALADFFGKRLESWHSAWVYAGVAAALLIIVFVASQILQKEEAGKQYAAAFEVSPMLESMMQQAARSSSTSISVISPENNANFDDGVFFKWEIKGSESELGNALDLKIMNNRQKAVFSRRVEQPEFSFKERLSPGLYYWTLESQGETLYLGKFFIMKP